MRFTSFFSAVGLFHNFSMLNLSQMAMLGLIVSKWPANDEQMKIVTFEKSRAYARLCLSIKSIEDDKSLRHFYYSVYSRTHRIFNAFSWENLYVVFNLLVLHGKMRDEG